MEQSSRGEKVKEAAKKIGRTLREEQSKVVHRVVDPLRLKFRPRDIIQIMVGSILLAIPIGFTEEVWTLGATLPLANVLFIAIFSILMISVFIYYNYYRNNMKEHWGEFLKRVTSVYVFSFLTVALFLSVIQAAPWGVDFMLSLKRTILVSFPASMSAAVVNFLK